MVAPPRLGIKSARDPVRRPTAAPVPRPSAAVRLLTARGSMAAKRSPSGADTSRAASPSRTILAAATAHGRAASEPAVASPTRDGPRPRGRRRVAGRPQERLRPVIGFRRDGHGATDDPAVTGRGRRQPPVVRPVDQVDGQAGVGRREQCLDAGAVAPPPVTASDRCDPVTPSSSRHGRRGTAPRSAGSAPIVTAAGSWISMSGQPAAASARRTSR